MASQEFEQIVGDQFNEFPPDEWQLYNCGAAFRYVEPNSGVGQAVLELTRNYYNANLAFQEHRAFIEEGLAVADSEAEELDAVRLEAMARWSVAYSLHNAIAQELGSFDYDAEAYPTYEQAVMRAADRQLDRISGYQYDPWQSPEEFIELSNTLAVGYRLETNCHFRDLVWPDTTTAQSEQ